MDDEDIEDAAIPFAQMHVDEIEELLQELQVELPEDELHQLAVFLKETGSFEAALEALQEVDRKAA